VPLKPGDRDGDGIADNVDKCPDEPEDKDGFEDADGCPDPDNDKDGILDAKDKCPLEPEDKDGFQDEDGCPDPDNDKDGFADANDKCPLEPEDKDGFEDEDGCPDPDNDKDGVLDTVDRCPNEPGPADNNGCPKKYEHIIVTQEKIELKQKIFFDTDKAIIQPRSFSLLDEIASVLRGRPTMTVRIEGHTDARGSRPHNLKLSQARADSVRQHLLGLGIEPQRMEPRGYGPDQPIETNKTAGGRERNRRVEFIITQQ
jgi:outer membrane protein OmpA-like peptidoglycan-associated protein